MTAPGVPARISPYHLISDVLDSGSYQSWDRPLNPLVIEAGYLDELEAARAKSNHDESVHTGQGTINGRTVAVILSDFRFLGGSIGVNAATRITEAIEGATRLGLPLLASPVSGGTRMQEGTPAFIQMARITAAINAHKAALLPYLVYLRHPTTGGVFASWGSLGHFTAAQPHALLGFLGPKVYKAIRGHEFPAGVQQAENIHRHGLIDAVLDPKYLRIFLIRILNAYYGKAEPEEAAVYPSPGPVRAEADSWQAVLASRNPSRPGLRAFLRHAATDLVPLSGTATREAVQAVSVFLAVIGTQGVVVVGLERRAYDVEGAFGPEALREAQRGMTLAAGLGLPLLTVIDTPGADLSQEAEEGGLGREIGRSLSQMLSLRTPTVTLILGQGAGGGALAIFPADRTVAVSNGWLGPLPPEGASTIVHGHTGLAAEMSRLQHIGAAALLQDGVIDEIIDEPEDPAADPEGFCRNAAIAIQRMLRSVTSIDLHILLEERGQRYGKIGTQELHLVHSETAN